MNTSHFPSLELCKKLTEIGFPGELTYTEKDGFYSQPSVMEMLDVMPKVLSDKKRSAMLKMGHDWCKYESYAPDNVEIQKERNEIYSNSLPNALAEMILWLHENNYISFNK